ncbi:MAG: (Fe-S)-binding protein, partial [Proteobacteria bacterium]|nr:(Fe-S)-binding protein [Pseudomonadota bacterium]
MPKQLKIFLFVQCLIDSLYPEIGNAVVTLLNTLGIPVIVPPNQTCCGQTAFNSGYLKEARKVAKHFIRVFEQADLIVCPSGSCVKMVRVHYPQIFQTDPEWMDRAKQISSKIFELTEFIVDVMGIHTIESRYQGKVTYHESCSIGRGLGIKQQPRELIKNIKNAEFIEMDDSARCCGFGGMFFLKYPEISTALATEKVANIIDTTADTVVSCDIGCLMNIEGLIGQKKYNVKCLH